MREKQKRSVRRRKLRRGQMQADLSRYGRRILDSDEMRQAFRQTHHTFSTVGEHTMRVAMTSLAICYALKKLRIKTDIPAVVTGSLCHDLGILGRGGKFHSSKECSRQHPMDSVEVAHKLRGELSEKEEAIITRHMWPVGKAKPPNSLEAAIVSAADKIAAVEDFVEGYEKKQPGLRGVIREIKSQRKENVIWKTKKES